MFSKTKSRHPLSMCADCGATGPSWVSVNRGVLICSDCCSVHRSMGRHISHVKCLKQGHWIPEQLTMVQSLYSCGANSIWEYGLLNPSSSKSGRKKPQPTDPVHPTKADFIRAKYEMLSFVYKPAKDDVLTTESDLSKQLHSSVRTPNLETSLRLLSQGADPNYFHPEKNSTPLAVAAKAGQVCQVELLLVYGADPASVDRAGRTAADYAKPSGYHGLATRIVTAQYELSDRLSYFLCGKRPEHSSNRHYLIPDITRGEGERVARKKMTGLSNRVFEELAVDVYDEVDRRETDSLWSKLEPGGSCQSAVVVPFLPVNPDYSATRNQGRQKLARLAQQEMAALVVDVLKEIKRRQAELDQVRGVATLANKKSPPVASYELNQTLQRLNIGKKEPASTGGRLAVGYRKSPVSDDEPLYDSVASDDDYYLLNDKTEVVAKVDILSKQQQQTMRDQNNKQEDSSKRDEVKSEVCDRTETAVDGGGVTLQRSKSLASADRDMAAGQSSEFVELKEQLECSEKKVQALIASNDDMRSEIARLTTTVQKLVNDNKVFQRSSMSPSHTYNTASSMSPSHTYNRTEQNMSPSHAAYSHENNTSQLMRAGDGIPYVDARSGSPIVSHGSPMRSPQSPGSRSHSMYEYRGESGSRGPVSLPGPGSSYINTATASPRPFSSQRRDSFEQNFGRYPSGGYGEGSHSLPYPLQHNYGDAAVYQEVLPSQEEVVRRTEAITRCIQELLISAKDEKFESFIPCSERIVRAVTDMVLLFPEDPGQSAISASLSSLTASATHFETECRMLIIRSQKEPLNQNFVTQQVIQCAFDIAKATKQLVALFQ